MMSPKPNHNSFVQKVHVLFTQFSQKVKLLNFLKLSKYFYKIASVTKNICFLLETAYLQKKFVQFSS